MTKNCGIEFIGKSVGDKVTQREFSQDTQESDLTEASVKNSTDF